MMLELNSDVWLYHGTPRSDVPYWLETVVPGFAQGNGPGLRAVTPAEVAERMGSATHAVMLCGHTHVPRLVQCQTKDASVLVVNPAAWAYPRMTMTIRTSLKTAPRMRAMRCWKKPAGAG